MANRKDRREGIQWETEMPCEQYNSGHWEKEYSAKERQAPDPNLRVWEAASPKQRKKTYVKVNETDY